MVLVCARNHADQIQAKRENNERDGRYDRAACARRSDRRFRGHTEGLVAWPQASRERGTQCRTQLVDVVIVAEVVFVMVVGWCATAVMVGAVTVVIVVFVVVFEWRSTTGTR